MALDDGDYAAGGARFEECLAVAQELRSPRTAYALEGLGYLALLQGDAGLRAARFEECLAQPSQQYLLRDYVHLGLAAVALHEGDAVAARGRIEASLLLGRERGEVLRRLHWGWTGAPPWPPPRAGPSAPSAWPAPLRC